MEGRQMIEALHRILPASASIVPGIWHLTADNVLKALDEQGVGFKVILLCSGDWEIECSELTDDEILVSLHMEDAGHEGDLLICTEACTRYGHDPFRCDARELNGFISEYEIEMFFDGDVVMLCEKSRTLTIFHHGGGYAHVKL